MGITRLHNFEHRNKAYFKVFKVKYVKLFVLGKSHEQICRDMVKGNNHHFQLFEKIGI